jgi:uncharacterized protein (DUF2147 family)
MMRIPFLLCFCALSMSASPAAEAFDYPAGYWVNDEQGWIVETQPCGEALCGYLVGFRIDHPHAPDYVSRDTLNPDPARREDPLCGMRLIGGFTPSKRADGAWENGWIYNPDSGKTYSAVISVMDVDTVRLRIYAGLPLFGRTLFLHREIGVTIRCAAPE